jgi:putative ABC transport system substrate-binding protein
VVHPTAEGSAITAIRARNRCLWALVHVCQGCGTEVFSATAHHELINSLALRHRMPAIHAFRYAVSSWGLASYGPNTIDGFRRAATYVDRILKGAKPSELPVQASNKYELVINLKTAKALGLEVPPALLATADEVIE